MRQVPPEEVLCVIDQLASEICAAVAAAAGGRPLRRVREKHWDYLAYHIPADTMRKLARDFRQRCAALTAGETLALVERLMREEPIDPGHVGLFILGFRAGELQPGDAHAIEAIAGLFHGWSHVDHFSAAVTQPLLKNHRDFTLRLLRAWNRYPDALKRRASVVAFTRKVGESGEFTDEVLELCEKLVGDEEDTVRKGVGWALKDNLRSAPERITAYVKDLRRRGVPAVITLYAIRDLRGTAREEVLAVTKAR